MKITFLQGLLGLCLVQQSFVFAHETHQLEHGGEATVKDTPQEHYFHSLVGTWLCQSDEQVNKLGKLQDEKKYSDRIEVDYDLEKSWISIRYVNDDTYQNQCYYDYVKSEDSYRQICISSKHAWSTAMGKMMDDQELTFKGKAFYEGRRLKTYKTFLKRKDQGIEVYSKIKDPKKLLSKTWSALCQKEAPRLSLNQSNALQ